MTIKSCSRIRLKTFVSAKSIPEMAAQVSVDILYFHRRFVSVRSSSLVRTCFTGSSSLVRTCLTGSSSLVRTCLTGSSSLVRTCLTGSCSTPQRCHSSTLQQDPNHLLN